MGFYVGQKVHYKGWSDIYPATVIKTTKTTVTIQQDRFHKDPEWEMDWVAGGFAGHLKNNRAQKNIIERNYEGIPIKFSLRKTGDYVMSGDHIRGGAVLRDGWKAFHDYNF